MNRSNTSHQALDWPGTGQGRHHRNPCQKEGNNETKTTSYESYVIFKDGTDEEDQNHQTAVGAA